MSARVSVIVLVYNHEAFLDDCLRGIVAQRDIAFEVIVGEDCSSDASRLKLDHWRRRYPDLIRVVTGPANLGSVANLRRCIAEARAEFIAFCEGDDWWTDERKLAKQIALMRDDVGLVHADLAVATLAPGGWRVQPGSVHQGRAPQSLRGALFGPLQRELTVKTCAAVYRKAALEDYLLTPMAAPHHLFADHPMALVCAAKWQVEYLPDVVAVYRHSPDSATRGSFPKTVRFLRDVLSMHAEFEQIFGQRGDFDRGACAWACKALAEAAFRVPDRSAFQQGIHGLRRLQPALLRDWRLRFRRFVIAVPPLHQAVLKLLNRGQAPASRATL